MTFPSTVKKSGPITISKTKPGPKTSTSSPRSPSSPLNATIKLISGSPVKAPPSSKTTKKDNVDSSIKSSLTSKPIQKVSIGSPVKKLSVPLKSPTVKSITKPIIDAKPELEKEVASTTKGETKSAIKPPPLKLNIKLIDSKELKSPTTLKSIPKTPTSPSVKSLKLTKSPIPSKSTLATRSPSVLSSVTKSSQASTVSSSVTKSQVTSGTKTLTTSSLEVKSAVVSSPVSKSPSFVSKTSMMTSMVPKSPRISANLSTSSVKSVSSKDQIIVMKPTTPIKKAVVSSTKNLTGVKLSTTSMNKPPVVPRSPTIVSNTKPSSVKTPASPSKLLTKEPSAVKISPSLKSIVNNKSNVISKSGPTLKIMVPKESSTSSLISVISSSTIKSTTSAMSKTSSQKVKVTTSTSVSKSVVPKSPIAKTLLLTVPKTTPSSPSMKTPSLPVVKTSMSSVVKSKTPVSKTRTLSLSSEKSPLSPTIKKAVPTKLILSPGLSKTKSLSSSRLSSVSTESLSSKSSLKSPISLKSTKGVKKILSREIKNTEEPKTKSIRGGQPLKKTIDIPGITELPSNIILNKQETLNVESKFENAVENILKEEIESTLTPQILLLDQDLLRSKELKTSLNVINIDNDTKVTSDYEKHLLPNEINALNVNHSTIFEDNNLQIIEENSIVEPTLIRLPKEKKQDENIEDCSSLDFVIVKKDECEPHLNNISLSPNNCGIEFDDNHFDSTNDNVSLNQLNVTESYTLDTEDNFEPMNDKLVLGDVPFETDSNQSDISDIEQTVQKEIIENKNCNITEKCSIDDVFLFSEHDLSINNFNRTDSTENFIQQFMPQSVKRSEGSSSISTDDGSLSRKSYSEVVSGSPKDSEYYYDYDIDMVDDCLEYDDEDKAVFVEVTEKEFPELKPKDLSGKRRKNKKQKKRNFSNRTGSQSDSNISENDYNPEEFDANEFCHYIKMMKDCSFYPNGLFSSDSVKLSTSSSLSWLDISVRTTDDDLIPSTESLSTYEVFQASNLNRDFLISIIGSTSTISTNETSWFWKSIEGRHQPHNKANITLSLKPGPKLLTTPRFMTLLALISEAKGYEIKPSLSEHFETSECMARFDDKIRRLMVQGFWLIGRLIKESLSKDEEVNCGNPFEFIDGDIGFWWAGINMLDWQEYIKECDKTQKLTNCYEFVMQNMKEKRPNFMKAELSMNAAPDDFMSELDVVNFIHTVRNVKYYCGNCFVDSEQNEENIETHDDDSFIGWENSSGEQH